MFIAECDARDSQEVKEIRANAHVAAHAPAMLAALSLIARNSTDFYAVSTATNALQILTDSATKGVQS